MAMPVRLFTGDAAVWEPWLALAVLSPSTVGFISLAARMYESSLLRTTGRVSLRTALRDRSVAIPR